MTSLPPIDQVLASNPDLGTVVEELQTGLSESFVFVLTTPNGKSVLKLQTDTAEHDFYLRFAPDKFPGARWLPGVLASGWHRDWNWLQLEYIPRPWPRSKWNNDERPLRILKTLHETAVSHNEFEWIDCSWQPADLAYCEGVLPKRTIDVLLKTREAYSELAGSDEVLCSGDPYPLNWLERPNGELVKIDWQGLALAHRAFDLAGWISSPIPLGDIEGVARLYLGLGNAVAEEGHVASLTREIVVFYARRCSSIFKHAAESNRPDRWQSGVARLTKDLPSWLNSVDHIF